MDRKQSHNHDERKKSTPSLPPLKSGKSVSALEVSSPEYRAVAMVQQAPLSHFSPMHSAPASLYVSSVDSKKSGVESYGLDRSALGFEKKTKSPEPTTPTHRLVGETHFWEKTSIYQPREIIEPQDYEPLDIQSTWRNPQLKSVPTYYPMERSNRIINHVELQEITNNLSQAFRTLAIQVKYIDSPAGAALLTPEQIEIYLYLWNTPEGICLEVQRRRGDSVTFHRYARSILEAASGDYEETTVADDSLYLKAAEKLLRTELASTSHEDAFSAVEIAATLLQKDRLDARVLGMESLCILSDPRKTNLKTAVLVSRALVLGSNEHESLQCIHEFVLHMIQRRTMVDEEFFIRDMVVDDYDSDDEEFFAEERQEGKPLEYQDSITTMVNYGFTILANAWEVLTTFESYHGEPESTSVQHSTDTLVAHFHKACLDLTHTDVLTTLVHEIQRCEVRAHNASLAAKCLRLVCQASAEARYRCKHGLESVQRAEQVGKATNVRLERECAQLRAILSEKF